MTTTLNASTAGAGGFIATSDNSGSLALQTAGATAVTIDTSQRTGFGTTSPASYGGTAFVKSVNIGSLNTITAGFSDEVTGTFRIAHASGQNILNFDTSALCFQSGGQTPVERMRIDSSGNLLIGQSSANFGGGICLTKNAVNSIAIFQNTAGDGSQCVRAILGAGTNNTNSFLFVGSAASQDNIYIYGNGNVVNRNNSYGALSDIKLKENVVDASPKLNDVMQLKVRNFNFKTDPDSKQIGFIAQEFEEVFPSLIDNTTSPNDPDDVIKAIKTSVLVPILVKAIQELKAINDTQAETINALTARIVAVETA
jgi:hypothetical protein